MYNPLNEEILDSGEEDQCCAGKAAVSVANTTGMVGPDELYAYEPGSYYVKVNIDDRLDDTQQKYEFPLELEFKVTGQSAEASPTMPKDAPSTETTEQTQSEDTTTGQASSEGQEQEPQSIKSEPTGESSSTLLLAIIVGLVALVAALGGALGVILFMRRR